MRYRELLKESVAPVPFEEILKAIQPIASRKIVWRGMSGGTVYQKVNNERSGFYGGIDDRAAGVVRGLNIKHPSFGSYSKSLTIQFGSLNVMVPIQPYRAMQSEKLTDLMHKSDLDTSELVDTYSERMDLELSEVVFDIKEYYLIGIEHALRIKMDPDDFAGHRLYKPIKKIVDGLKTYQDVIDVLSEKQ